MIKINLKYIRILKTIIVAAVVFVLCGSCLFAKAEVENVIENEQATAAEKADELLSENSARDILNDFLEKLKESFFGYSKSFALLLFITLMLGIINTLCGEGAALYAGQICLCSVAFLIIGTVCENIISVMNTLSAFMLSMLPVMTSLYTTSVGAATASMSYSSTVLMLNLCSTLFTALLIPSVKCIIVFSTVTMISRSFDFSGFAKCLRSIVGWLFGIVMCIMSAVIYFQSVISVSKDGLASRTVRYAASSLIPVIGNVVSESARTLSESLKLVRSVSGTAAIFAIIGIIAAPIAALAVCRTFILICGALAKLLGSTKASAFYTDMCGALSLLLGAVIGISIVIILILGIFAKVSAQL